MGTSSVFHLQSTPKNNTTILLSSQPSQSGIASEDLTNMNTPKRMDGLSKTFKSSHNISYDMRLYEK